MSSPFDLRLRILGIGFCIQPSFWIMNALFAFVIYNYVGAVRGVSLFAYILIWVLCILVCVLVHELGHVITGRIFGQPGQVTLGGLGGQTAGEYDQLSVWQRIVFHGAGPGAGFLFVALLVIFDGNTTMWNLLMDHFDLQGLKSRWFLVDRIDPLLRRGGSEYYIMVIQFLAFFSLFVNIMNLLPIIPMDGGMIFKEICCLVSPTGGLKFAFAWSFLLASLVTLFYLYVTLMSFGIVPVLFIYPFLFPWLSLIIFAMLAYRCYATYRQLATTDRHMAYMQDDMSGPRDPSPGVREIPVKDPRDFAPPAPGSEKPRY